MSNITHIKQPDNFGCGIACVAMIVGKEYSELRRLMPSDALATRDGCRPRLLWYLLGYFGYHCRVMVWNNHEDSWPVLDSQYNILRVYDPLSHFVLEHEGTVYDPGKDELSTIEDYGFSNLIIGVSKPVTCNN